MKIRKYEFMISNHNFVCDRIAAYGNVSACPVCGVEGVLDIQYNYDPIQSAIDIEPKLSTLEQNSRILFII